MSGLTSLAAPERWPIPNDLLESPAVTNRNQLARKFAATLPDRILKQYIKMDAEGARRFYNRVLDVIGDVSFQGTGIELGAGVAAFSTVVAMRYRQVEKIYAVELVPDVVTMLQPVTIPAIDSERAGVFQPVIGSFDCLSLDDASVDFCVEFASLHHSDDLIGTLREVARVLRPGGLLLAVDRAHNDGVTDAQRAFMLNVAYPAAWKAENGYDDAPLTRRENGEHEILLKEWREAFAETGFTEIKHHELRHVAWPKLWRGAVLTLPFGLRRRMNWAPSRARWHQGEWWWQLGNLLGLTGDGRFVRASHDYSLFLLKKAQTGRL